MLELVQIMLSQFWLGTLALEFIEESKDRHNSIAQWWGWLQGVSSFGILEITKVTFNVGQGWQDSMRLLKTHLMLGKGGWDYSSY